MAFLFLRGHRWLAITQILSLIIIIILAGLQFHHVRPEASYPYIAKRLFVTDPNDVIINFTPLREKLTTYVTDSTEKIGVYFEYLPTGVSININGKDEFFRASLVKLPVVMRAYNFIEQKQLSLDDKLTIEEKQLDKNFGELWKRGAGTTVTVRELIQFILEDSDNTAFNVLYERVNVQLLGDAPNNDRAADDVYDYLDIPRAMEGMTPMITPKNYASILKSVYFSAYLSYQHSNDILTSLTTAHTKNWMRSQVRPGIEVADKIGVYDVDSPELRVFSDCGIVYYPERPYTLCVMINSGSAEKSIKHIQDISRLVFEYIDLRS